jgi:hypothetical protein
MRQPISKRVRFEVFKRDLFTCQYCGATPPDVVLEVDHIEAVANGGGNEEGNLVTACFDCNRGKSAVALTVAPEPLAERAERVAEAEAQLAAYRAVMRDLEERKDVDAWAVLFALYGENFTTKARYSSVRTFLERLPYETVLEAAEVAGRTRYGKDRKFRYFCGICWKRIGGDGE